MIEDLTTSLCGFLTNGLDGSGRGVRLRVKKLVIDGVLRGPLCCGRAEKRDGLNGRITCKSSLIGATFCSVQHEFTFSSVERVRVREQPVHSLCEVRARSVDLS